MKLCFDSTTVGCADLRWGFPNVFLGELAGGTRKISEVFHDFFRRRLFSVHTLNDGIAWKTTMIREDVVVDDWVRRWMDRDRAASFDLQVERTFGRFDDPVFGDSFPLQPDGSFQDVPWNR